MVCSQLGQLLEGERGKDSEGTGSGSEKRDMRNDERKTGPFSN